MTRVIRPMLFGAALLVVAGLGARASADPGRDAAWEPQPVEDDDDVAPAPVAPEEIAAQPGTQVTADDFYEQLSPYGEWTDLVGFGRVWRPNQAYVGASFRPYASGGHWVYTPYGWSFVSEYPFDWAVFHYGRWALDVTFGWVWVPDVLWGPAWVDWRSGGGYVGWAPLPPLGWRATWFDPYWSFVETGMFVRSDVGVYVVPRERVRYVFQTTSPIDRVVRYHGTAYCPGPSAAHVSRVTGSPVHPVPVAAVWAGGHSHPVPSFSGGFGHGRAMPTSPVPASPQFRGGAVHPVPTMPMPMSQPPVVMMQRQIPHATPQFPTAPVPMQRYSAPVPMQRYSAPAMQRYSAPVPMQRYGAPAMQRYSAPVPMQRYSAPVPMQRYSAPVPMQRYSAPVPMQRYSAQPAQFHPSPGRRR